MRVLRLGLANQAQPAATSAPLTPRVATGNEAQLLLADEPDIEDVVARVATAARAQDSRPYQSDVPTDRIVRTTSHAGDDAEDEESGASSVIFGFSFGVVLTAVGAPSRRHAVPSPTPHSACGAAATER